MKNEIINAKVVIDGNNYKLVRDNNFVIEKGAYLVPEEIKIFKMKSILCLGFDKIDKKALYHYSHSWKVCAM